MFHNKHIFIIAPTFSRAPFPPSHPQNANQQQQWSDITKKLIRQRKVGNGEKRKSDEEECWALPPTLGANSFSFSSCAFYISWFSFRPPPLTEGEILWKIFIQFQELDVQLARETSSSSFFWSHWRRKAPMNPNKSIPATNWISLVPPAPQSYAIWFNALLFLDLNTFSPLTFLSLFILCCWLGSFSVVHCVRCYAFMERIGEWDITWEKRIFNSVLDAEVFLSFLLWLLVVEVSFGLRGLMCRWCQLN